MAFSRINDKVDFDGTGMAGGSTSYFHFVDLEKIRERHPDAEGFRVVNGTYDEEECAILVLIKGKTDAGATFIFEKEGHSVAFSCPKLVDTIGGKDLEEEEEEEA